VDLSGVIFVVLALVWAAYLLPKALRHHDEVARTRSVDEVSEQARVVVSAPDREQRRPGRARRARTAAAGRTAALTPAGRAARRRRRILALLVAACAVTAVAAAAAVVPVWAVVVPAGLLVGFLVLCRVLVRRDRARQVAARRTSGPVAPAQRVANVPVAAAPAPAPAPAATAPAAVTPDTAVEAPVMEAPGPSSSAPVGSLDDTGAFRELVGLPVQRESSSAHGQPAPGSLWDPLPVTLPTYVGKQRAMRSVRTISLGDPGVSSSGRDAADSALVAGAQAGTTQPGDDAPRVVGG
jgi:hypothetical protein